MIRVLPQHIINKIAAGEVVERPASIVKELIENSIDAKADEISVEIFSGGKKMIRIADNGQGISAKELSLCVKPHATSKIEKIDDLYSIHSFGFRGEALSSIAAVSRFSLITKTKSAETALKLTKEQNKVSISDSAGLPGSTAEARDLFFNVPARAKFLKSDFTEFRHIVDILEKFALIHPKISFSLKHNNILIALYRKRAEGQEGSEANWRQRIEEIIGREIIDQMLKLEQKSSLITAQGFISQPHAGLSQAKSLSSYVFVNQRPVQDFIIFKAVRQGYGNLISKDAKPLFILDLRIRPEEVDVNVHPRKIEVKFKEPGAVFGFVKKAVRQALAGSQSIFIAPQYSISQKESVDFQFYNYKKSIKPQKTQYAPINTRASIVKEIPAIRESYNDQIESRKLAGSDLFKLNNYRIIGQIMDAFILAEKDRKFLVYDQHAVSERVEYQRIKNRTVSQSAVKQELFIPINLDLNAKQKLVLEEYKEIFQNLGFLIEPFGANNFIVQAVPQTLKEKNIKEIIFGLLSDLEQEKSQLQTLEQQQEKIIERLACRSAVKFGDRLNLQEMEKLIDDLENLGGAGVSCAHGRSVVKQFSQGEMRKWFGR